jgi:hypothetical protein
MKRLANGAIDLTGQVFRFLTVKERDTSPRRGVSRSARWWCECICGKMISVRADRLRKGKKSCGCRQERPSCSAERNYHWKGCGLISGEVWCDIRQSAKKRPHIEFSITIEEAWQIYLRQEGRCAITGVEIVFSKTTERRKRTASLDRIDSSKGYVSGNVQWVHKEINRLKWDMRQDEFIEWCMLVTAHSVTRLSEALRQESSLSLAQRQ